MALQHCSWTMASHGHHVVHHGDKLLPLSLAASSRPRNTVSVECASYRKGMPPTPAGAFATVVAAKQDICAVTKSFTEAVAQALVTVIVQLHYRHSLSSDTHACSSRAESVACPSTISSSATYRCTAVAPLHRRSCCSKALRTAALSRTMLDFALHKAAHVSGALPMVQSDCAACQRLSNSFSIHVPTCEHAGPPPLCFSMSCAQHIHESPHQA